MYSDRELTTCSLPRSGQASGRSHHSHLYAAEKKIRNEAGQSSRGLRSGKEELNGISTAVQARLPRKVQKTVTQRFPLVTNIRCGQSWDKLCSPNCGRSPNNGTNSH